MPIYEFYCDGCHAIYQFFSQSINTEKQPDCPKCGQQQLERVMSAFAFTRSNSEESDNGGDLPLDDSRIESAMMALAGEADKLDEDNPRAAAKLMRKISEASGLKMGVGMEEALARMERGDDPDRIEEEMGATLDAEEPFVTGTGNGNGTETGTGKPTGGKPGNGTAATHRTHQPTRDETIYDL